MAVFKNCYHVLGLADFADADTVKAAFRQLARRHHPDLNAGNAEAEEKFKEINAAYETLSDPAKRARHDHILQAMQGGVTGKSVKKTAHSSSATVSKNRPPGDKKAAAPGERASSNQPNSGSFGDFFERFLRRGGFSGSASPENAPREGNTPKEAQNKREGETQKESAKESAQEPARKEEGGKSERSGKSPASGDGIFGPIWGSVASGKSEKPRRGEDVVVKMAISPLEAMEGVIKPVQVEHRELCRRCSGTGRVNGAPCTACQGEKTQTRVRKMDVRIPAGVKTGSRVRVAREGGRGSGGGENGDLFLQIDVADDASLRIEGLDVYGEVALSVTDAVLGTEIDIVTLNGPVKMTVPAGTQPGRVFRLKGRGLQSGGETGDHFVTVTLTIPDKLTPREHELYRELARLRPRKP
jgi:molecular chaperone DnaJ